MTRNNEKKYIIKKATPRNVNVVVDLHTKSFSGYFLTSLGDEFLECFYRHMLENEGVGFVLINERGEPAGFVIGVNSTSSFYAGFLLRHFFLLLKALFYSMTTGKLALRDVFTRTFKIPMAIFKSVIGNVKRPSKIKNSHFEIMSIAVDESLRGSGAGRALVEELFKFLRERDYSSVGVSCRKDNSSALAFYTRMGFQPYSEAGDVVHLRVKF